MLRPSSVLPAVCLSALAALALSASAPGCANPTDIDPIPGRRPDASTDAQTDAAIAEDGATGTDGAAEGATDETGADSPVDQASPDAGTDAATCDAIPVINEVKPDGTDDPDNEYVELFNPGGCAIPLDDVSLYFRTASGTQDQILWTAISGQTLKPKQYFVVGGSKYGPGAPDFQYAGASLPLEGGGLGLKRGQKTLDMMGWGTAKNAYVDGSPAPAPQLGMSVGRKPDGVDTDNNSADFAQGPPTPRAANQ